MSYQQPSDQREAVSALLSTWASNLHRNTTAAFANATAKDYIRLVAIVGAYALLRPHLMRLGAKMQAREHERANRSAAAAEKEEDDDDEVVRDRKPFIRLPGLDSGDEDEDGEEHRPEEWGRRAKRRQRELIRRRLEEHEQALGGWGERESDEEIADLLEEDD